jgi:hypothetical protein
LRVVRANRSRNQSGSTLLQNHKLESSFAQAHVSNMREGSPPDMSALHTLDLEFREPATSPEFSRVMTYRGFTVAHTSMKLPMEYEYAWSGGAHYLARHDLVLERGELTLDGGEPITRRDAQHHDLCA